MGALLACIKRRASRNEVVFYKAYNINDTLGQNLLSVGIGKKQLYDLHQIFSAMDLDNSGEINIREFFDYVDINRTRFSEKAFTVMDRDGSGEVDFIEFVLAVWNYCSFSKASLVRYAFDLYDLDGSGEIEKDEVARCVREVWGNEWEHNANAQKIMAKLDAVMQTTTNEKLTIQLFQDFAYRHPILLFPAFQVQTEIQRRVLGTRFWQNAARRRSQVDPRDLNWRNFDKMANLSKQNSQKFLESIDSVLHDESTLSPEPPPELSRKPSSLFHALTKVRHQSAKIFLDEVRADAMDGDGDGTQNAVTSFAEPPRARQPKHEQVTRQRSLPQTVSLSPPNAIPHTEKPTMLNGTAPSSKKKKKKTALANDGETPLVVEDVGEASNNLPT